MFNCSLLLIHVTYLAISFTFYWLTWHRKESTGILSTLAYNKTKYGTHAILRKSYFETHLLNMSLFMIHRTRLTFVNVK